VTSAMWTMASPAADAISSATVSAASVSWTALTTILAPSAASASAVARPMLRADPVIRAVFPSRLPGFFLAISVSSLY